MFDVARSGKTAEAIALHRELIPFMNLAFGETNPGPMKSVMDLIGVDAPRLLAPLRDARPELSAALRTECKRLLDKYESRDAALAS